MALPPVNFLNDSPSPSPTKHRGGALRRLRIIIATPVVVFVALSLLTEFSPVLPSPLREPLRELRPFSLFRLLPSADRVLQEERNGRVNILLLGIGGGDHEGAYLTDTIIVASLETRQQKAALLSLPRDMVVNLRNGQWRKVNVINSYAEEAEKGSGPEATRKALETVLAIPIPYVIRIDFSGFTKLIDALDGIDIEVERTLDDPRYPIQGRETVLPIEDRYEHLVIPKGWQHFNGATALKFTRSRYGLNGEGSDFARSRRQQKVLLALRQKLMTASTLLSPTRLQTLQNLLRTHVQTNMSSWEFLRLADLLRDVDPSSLIHRVIDDSPNSPLQNAVGINGAYILMPKGGSFEPLAAIARTIFDEQSIQSGDQRGRTRVSVLNGTSIDGLAARVTQRIVHPTLSVTYVGNAPVKGVSETLIIDRSNSEKALEREYLRSVLGAPVTSILPAWLSTSSPIPQQGQSDFIVLLGTDQETITKP